MKSFSLIVYLFCILNSFGQSSYETIFSDSLKEISWSIGISYLPSFHAESVVLKADQTNLTAEYRKIGRKRFVGSTKKRIKLTKNEFVEVYDLYTRLNQRYVQFAITEFDKDLMRKFLNDPLNTGERYYKLDSIQLSRYLEKDTIEIDMSVFQIDSINGSLYGKVIDGAPFRFQVMKCTSDNDTIIANYDGNLLGGERYRDYPKYLVLSTLYNETSIFAQLPFEEYFSRSNLLRVFLNYMEGKEGLLEFKPPPFFLEDN